MSARSAGLVGSVDWTSLGDPNHKECSTVTIQPIRLFGDPVLRTPADPVETAECWSLALKDRRHPDNSPEP